MPPFLKITCPNAAGFVGSAKLNVYKHNGDFVGDTRIDCPVSPPENTTIRYITDAGNESKTWRIEVTLTNQSNGHTSNQVFNGSYIPGQQKTTTGKASVTLDGVTLSGGTGYT
jgi:hypothetical protein